MCDPQGRVLLERRPADGLWGGLWSLPEPARDEDPALWCRSRLGCRPLAVRALPAIRHAFTHFELDIEPLRLDVDGGRCAMAGEDRLWYNPRTPARVGLAAVVERLLSRLGAEGESTGGPGEAADESPSGGKP